MGRVTRAFSDHALDRAQDRFMHSPWRGIAMIDLFKQLVHSQFQASLGMFGRCIQACPDGLWNQPVARYPFCQVAFHALFFTDYYLGPDAQSFRRQPFHLDNAAVFGDYEQLEDREPTSLYHKPQIEAYLDFCRRKATQAIAAETEATLAATTKFPRQHGSRAESHVNNIRHVQHHAAQMILRLRLQGDIDIPWIAALTN